MLLPAPAEPHAHLDKAHTWDLLDPPIGGIDAIFSRPWPAERWAAIRTPHAMRERAMRQLDAMLRHGTTAVRTHVDIPPAGGDPLLGVRVLCALRDELAGVIDLQLVALFGPTVPDAVIERAVELGLDLIGGAPHTTPDPTREVERLVALADRLGLGLDLHMDERLEGRESLSALADATREWPASRARAASHSVLLGTLPADEQAAITSRLAASRVDVITLPGTNLYLQDWDGDPRRRGLPPLHLLLDNGVRVAGGGDNVRDPFNPLGRADPFETASLLVLAGHLTPADAWYAVSTGARAVLGLEANSIEPGSVADLVLVPGTSLGDALADARTDRVVLHNGRVVAVTTSRSSSAIDGDASGNTINRPPRGTP
ncbi:amidohydrolase family protein [Leifsonia sp. H3M29-4]|uniref:amidohydrolase family protein n=1 Tax=Salinibacterium metalliresistens TaxID=3031321 RepID=UPI0023DC9003|nr:amidohydrolase family protein [Salinibacterium metalliresistens]MDF1479319.1 amidohydrolase family protein [Salinibacterium metalliresistens]